MASYGWCQQTPQSAPKEESLPPAAEPLPGPALGAYPLELLGLATPPRGGTTLTPSLAISEEYNDNIFLDNSNRHWDLITSFSPALVLTVNRPSYSLNVGYTFSGQLYAKEDRFSNVFEHQALIAFGSYRPSSTLRFDVSDRFSYDRNTNIVAQGFSTGRQESWSNSFTTGLLWTVTAQDTVGLGLRSSVVRFLGQGGGFDSDTYEVLTGYDHKFTGRLTAGIHYDFQYLDSQLDGVSTTHTPKLSFSYRLTPSLTANIVGGPAITQIHGETTVSPAGVASLVQDLRFGQASIQYSRGVSVAGGFGGATDIQTIGGLLVISTWVRGLLIGVSPAYLIADSLTSRQTAQIHVKTLTVDLKASYQLATAVSIFGGYSFFQQRTGSSSTTELQVDQNRVTFGVQFGYPFHFD